MYKNIEEVLNSFTDKLNDDFGTENSIENNETELQRTEAWHLDRLGMFTGSRLGDLMTCKSKAKGKSWTDKKWLLDFGDPALTYIIERAIERMTGEKIQTPETWQMRWGTEHEPEGKAFFEKTYIATVEEVGFIKFLKNAGASADGLIDGNIGFELKCPATINSHYKLMTEPVAEGHAYFWQMQGEMLALNVNKLVFATYDPRYPDNFKLGTHEVELSSIHVTALYFRLIVAEKLVNILMHDLRTDLRGDLLRISANVPDNYDELLKWIDDERRALAI